MKYTKRNGRLRIYDSSDIIAKGSADNLDVEVYDNSEDTFTDKTAEAFAAGADFTGEFLVDTDDAVFVGCNSKFARIKFVKGASGAYAVGAGALSATYYNGSTWAALTILDGTAVGGHTFKQDGIISFAIPPDWALQGDADLSATMYYIKLTCAAAPSTAPNADVLGAADGQFYEVPFVEAGIDGPLGRTKAQEELVMDRGVMTALAHYVLLSDESLYEPMDISFSLLMDDIYNNNFIQDAMACGDPDSTYWTATGESSKGSSKNDGVYANPPFIDSGKKTVNIQVLWEGNNGDLGMAYYEVWFDLQGASVSEGDKGVVLQVKGGVYGVIESIYGFGNRY
jgi:hypothetical protein